DHPHQAHSLGPRGDTRGPVDDVPAASPDHERALAIRGRKRPAERLHLPASLALAAQALVPAGRAAERRVRMERSLASYRDKLGPEDVRIAQGFVGLGLAQVALGKLDEADASWTRALAIAEKDHGGAPDLVAAIAFDMADLRLRQGRAADA